MFKTKKYVSKNSLVGILIFLANSFLLPVTLTALLTALQTALQTATPVYSKEPPFTGSVVAVSDGDTIKILHNGQAETLRLSGIDCPEKHQAFGIVAKRFTAGACFGKQVKVIPIQKDRYKRTVAEVILPDGSSLNRSLVENGYAWWYRQYAPNDMEMAQAEAQARSMHLGLWSDSEAVEPWEFRRKKRKRY